MAMNEMETTRFEIEEAHNAFMLSCGDGNMKGETIGVLIAQGSKHRGAIVTLITRANAYSMMEAVTRENERLIIEKGELKEELEKLTAIDQVELSKEKGES